MSMFKFKQMTKDFEGYRDRPYKDTKGIPTVGYGFNISSGGIPDDVATGKRPMSVPEADAIFEPKYAEAQGRAARFAGRAYGSLDETKQGILNDMAYNLGDRLFKFEDMRSAIVENRLGDAPAEMKDSLWYNQVGDRSKALIELWNGQESDPYTTPLTPQEKPAFDAWKAKYAPNDSGMDYDLQGAFKAGVTPGANGHWTDRFKKPNHKTFSIESQYAKDAPEKAGRWEGENYISPDSYDKPIQKLSRFGKAFKEAKMAGKKQFMFDGNPIAVK